MQTVIARLSSNVSTEVIDWHGGGGSFSANGNFAAGSLLLESSIDGGATWISCKDSSGADLALTATGIISFSIGSCKLRTTMSGSTVAAGTLQVETAAVVTEDVVPNVGLVPVTITITSALFSPPKSFVISVPPRVGKAEWVPVIYEILNKSAELAPYYTVSRSGASGIALTAITPAAANDTSLVMTIVGSNGMTTSVTSGNTTAGVAATPNVLVSVQKR